MLNNFGMGSILVNYYRKQTETDEYVPNVSSLVIYKYDLPYILIPNLPVARYWTASLA